MGHRHLAVKWNATSNGIITSGGGRKSRSLFSYFHWALSFPAQRPTTPQQDPLFADILYIIIVLGTMMISDQSHLIVMLFVLLLVTVQ